MKERAPTAQDIQELVDYQPRLFGNGAPEPVVRRHMEAADGSLIMPLPDCDEAVSSFITLTENQGGCWMDCNYIPEKARELLEDEEAV